MKTPTPPRWLERLAGKALGDGPGGSGALGDLSEAWTERARSSPVRASFWYAGQTISIVAHRAMAGRRRTPDSDVGADLRWAFRLMGRHPGFALGVVCVLGLGIGSNAAVFTVVDGTFRNASWWAEPDRTLVVWPEREWSFGLMEMYREDQRAYRSVGGYAELAFAVETADGESQSVNGVVVTPAIFRELSVQPVLGRGLVPDDALLGVQPVVVIGEELWRRSFGADPDMVGRAIRVSGATATVVGVQGAGGRAPGGRAELWFPLVMDPRDDDYFRAQTLTIVGTLRPGVGIDDATEELLAYTERLSNLFPMFYPLGFADGRTSVARADERQRRLVSTPLLLLMGGTALLLLVTALNVGTLLLGQAVERRREFAVRAAIGAGRGRILRQLLAEGGALTALALALGLCGAALGGPAIASLFVDEVVVAASPVTSRAVVLFALATGALAWVILSGVPITYFLRARRDGLDLSPTSGAAVQRSLVAVQAGLATLLLVSAALLVATVANLRDVPLGFDTDGILAVELSPPADRVETPARARELYERLVVGTSAIPGVEAAGLTGWLPLRTDAPTTPVNLETAPVDPAAAPNVPMHKVDPGFFEVFGIEASAGRLLGTEDQRSEPGAVVVNETLARTLWPDGRAVGQSIAIDPHAWDRWVPVVGVIPDVRNDDMTSPPGPALYVALAEDAARDVTLVVRASGGAGLASAVRSVVAEVDPLVPVRSASWMEEVVRTAYSTAWVVMGLLVVLAVLATALGAIGVYAVLAHHVAANRREMGVRMALGADPAAVVRQVVGSGMLLSAGGILAGCLVAAGLSRYLESLLFGVSTLAPWAYIAPAMALSVATALAAWIPARRAGRLPPAEVLKGP